MIQVYTFNSHFSSKYYLELGVSNKKIVFSNLRAGFKKADSDFADCSGLALMIQKRLEYKDSNLSLNHFDLSKLSVFAREVLSALFYSRAGQTFSYGDLATIIGRPGASRAVGTQCASNPFQLLIPCHRVVLKSGKIGNYSGEGASAAKTELLDYEFAIASSF